MYDIILKEWKIYKSNLQLLANSYFHEKIHFIPNFIIEFFNNINLINIFKNQIFEYYNSYSIKTHYPLLQYLSNESLIYLQNKLKKQQLNQLDYSNNKYKRNYPLTFTNIKEQIDYEKQLLKISINSMKNELKEFFNYNNQFKQYFQQQQSIVQSSFQINTSKNITNLIETFQNSIKIQIFQEVDTLNTAFLLDQIANQVIKKAEELKNDIFNHSNNNIFIQGLKDWIINCRLEHTNYINEELLKYESLFDIYLKQLKKHLEDLYIIQWTKLLNSQLKNAYVTFNEIYQYLLNNLNIEINESTKRDDIILHIKGVLTELQQDIEQTLQVIEQLSKNDNEFDILSNQINQYTIELNAYRLHFTLIQCCEIEINQIDQQMNLNIIKLNQIINDYIQNIKENSISFHECQLLIDRHSRENIQGKELQINLQQSCQQQFETVINEYIQCFRKLLQSFLFPKLKIVNHNINQPIFNESSFDLSKEFQWKQI